MNSLRRYTKKVKKPLLILLVIAGLIAAGYIYATQNNALPQNRVEIPAEMSTLQGNVSQQFSVFSSRAQEIGGHAQNLLSSSVQVDETQPSFQEKAINYGQYLYCKQVVESYEENKQ